MEEINTFGKMSLTTIVLERHEEQRDKMCEDVSFKVICRESKSQQESSITQAN